MKQYQLHDDGSWPLSETKDPTGSIELPVLGAELELARIYERVEFDQERSTAQS